MRRLMWMWCVALAACGDPNPDTCGNGTLEAPEECDSGGPIACTELGFATGFAACNACALDVTECRGECGDGMLSPDEECEGSMFAEGFTCTDLGFAGGTVTCVDCMASADGCTNDGGTIEVRVNGVVQEGVAVAIADANGTSVASLETDSTGKVTTAVPPDSTAIVAYTRADGKTREVRSFEKFNGGGLLRVNFLDPATIQVSVEGSTSTTFPAPLAGGTTHRSRNGCLEATSGVSSPNPQNLSVFNTCVDANGNAERYAEILNGTGDLLGFHHATDIPVTPGTPTATPVPAWVETLAPLTCRVDNAPMADDMTFVFSGRFGRMNYTTSNILVIAPQQGSTVERSRPFPDAAFVQRAQCTVILDDNRQCSKGAATAQSNVFDGLDFIVEIFSGAVDTTNPSRPQATWTQDVTGGAPDATLVQLSFTGAGDTLTWLAFAPPGGTALRLPELPADARFDPYLLDHFNFGGGTNRVVHIELFEIPTYQDFMEDTALLADPDANRCTSSLNF